ncbi:MAG: hypothetical protein J0M15_09190 [Deltaproteobacteria bacterium]|nr:hypothetical protein [Deltaproteobacteria bacterium]
MKNFQTPSKGFLLLRLVILILLLIKFYPFSKVKNYIQRQYLPLIFSLFSINSFASSYGAYGHYSLGSSRVLGLAGAYTALSEDSNAFILNPAGTGFAKWSYNLDGANNILNNDELDIDSNGVGKSQTQNLSLFGVHYKNKIFSIGIGVIQPYAVGLINNFSATEKKLSIKDTALNLSHCPISNFCLGVNVIESKATQSVSSFAEVSEQEHSLIHYKYGMAIRFNEDIGFGYSYTGKSFWDFSNPKSNYFNSVIIPEKNSLGFFYNLKDQKTKIVFDLDTFKSPGTYTYVFESNEYSNLVPVADKEVSIFRLGAEQLLMKRTKTSVTWRVGYYREPSRIDTSLDRNHFTIGLEARIGPAILQAAMDQAKSFNNVSQSFSVLIDNL